VSSPPVRGGPELPEALTVALPEYNDHLSPTFALPNPDAPLAGTDFPKAPGGGAAPTVNDHHVELSASVVPAAFCARTCQ
jgi:hypothetical protein